MRNPDLEAAWEKVPHKLEEQSEIVTGIKFLSSL